MYCRDFLDTVCAFHKTCGQVTSTAAFVFNMNDRSQIMLLELFGHVKHTLKNTQSKGVLPVNGTCTPPKIPLW